MLEYIITNYGAQILNAILCAIFGCLGYALKKLATKYINDDTKRAVAKTAAAYVEQVWKDIHGEEKLDKAISVAADFLLDKGIPFTTHELKILIEAAVAEFNDAFKKPETAETVDRNNDAPPPCA